ncbi:DUF4391 domain-containing protein [Haemophilus haemolyticus]|jgi:hypothetical protein|uniref:DUF4391 domain-containing protein n=1 Tax=Haemophilus haemolyticus TaxID=726 RepID=UPI003D8083D6
MIYQYPARTLVDKLIPKSKFYSEGGANTRVERLFIEQIESIYWANKLSSATMNIESQEDLREVQIFSVNARVEMLDIEIFRYIDKLIPSPIIFEVYFQDKVKVIAAYKRLNQADNSKVVIGDYFQTEWLPIERQNLPLFLRLNELYEFLISQLLPNKTNASSLAEKMRLNQEIALLETRMKQLEQQLKREKQFNRKAELNINLLKLRDEYIQLTSSSKDNLCQI